MSGDVISINSDSSNSTGETRKESEYDCTRGYRTNREGGLMSITCKLNWTMDGPKGHKVMSPVGERVHAETSTLSCGGDDSPSYGNRDVGRTGHPLGSEASSPGSHGSPVCDDDSWHPSIKERRQMHEKENDNLIDDFVAFPGDSLGVAGGP